MNNASFIKQFSQLAASTIINLIIGIITTPIITRLVNPSEYGQLSLFNTYSAIVMMLFCLGMDQTLVRYYYLKSEPEYKVEIFRKCFKTPLIVSIIGSVLIILIRKNYPSLGGFDSIVMFFFIANIFVLLLNRFGMTILRLQYKTGMYSFLNVLHKALYVVIVIPLVIWYDHYYLYILVGTTVVSVLVSSIISIVCEKKYWVGGWFNKNIEIRKMELIRYGFPLMIASAVFLVFQATDKICVSYFGTYSDVGIYSSAQSLMAVFSVIQSTFNTLWVPKAIEHYENYPNNRTFYSNMNQIISVLMFVFGAFVLLFKDVFVLLLGESYREAATIIPFLMFNPIMYTISETTVIGLSITKKTNCQVLITGAVCAINIVGNIVLIPILGPKGAAVSTGISYIVFFIMRTLFSKHYFSVNYKLRKLFLLTAVFLVNSTVNMYHSFDVYVIVSFFVTIIICVVLYRRIIIDSTHIVLDLLKKNRCGKHL